MPWARGDGQAPVAVLCWRRRIPFPAGWETAAHRGQGQRWREQQNPRYPWDFQRSCWTPTTLLHIRCPGSQAGCPGSVAVWESAAPGRSRRQPGPAQVQARERGPGQERCSQLCSHQLHPPRPGPGTAPDAASDQSCPGQGLARAWSTPCAPSAGAPQAAPQNCCCCSLAPDCIQLPTKLIWSQASFPAPHKADPCSHPTCPAALGGCRAPRSSKKGGVEVLVQDMFLSLRLMHFPGRDCS